MDRLVIELIGVNLISEISTIDDGLVESSGISVVLISGLSPFAIFVNRNGL